jgi:hypothetical protein
MQTIPLLQCLQRVFQPRGLQLEAVYLHLLEHFLAIRKIHGGRLLLQSRNDFTQIRSMQIQPDSLCPTFVSRKQEQNEQAASHKAAS